MMFLAASLAVPPIARADPGQDLVGRIRLAFSGVTSFTLDQAWPGGKSHAVIVLPDLSSAAATMGRKTSDVVTQGSTKLERTNGGVWRPHTFNAAGSKNALDSFLYYAQQVTALPDRREGRSQVGAFSYVSAPPNAFIPPNAQIAICTYDKKTYLLRTCRWTNARGYLITTYGRWNDPRNTVVIPSNIGPSASPEPSVFAPPPTPRPTLPPSPMRLH
jgi:hypothetical protein